MSLENVILIKLSTFFYGFKLVYSIWFQLITTTRSLVLCADSRREMEDWLAALKAASLRNNHYYFNCNKFF